MLESLERRVLLDAGIQVSGRSQGISNGELAPDTRDLTDFRSASTMVSKNIGVTGHVFNIMDTGDSPLQLGDVIVSGANKGDFTLTTQPSTIILPGGSSAFTLSFKPRGTGVRTAMVTIHSNDPSTPDFTFAVQGTGVKPTNLGQNLLSATTRTGSGNSAVLGSQVTVNYTEWLPNGLVVDSSVPDPQVPSPHASMQIIIDAHKVIAGWEQGLVGIQPGETRILFIPAALAYGETGNSSGLVTVPPNSPLILSVTAVTVSAAPTLEVTGNNDGSDVPIIEGSEIPTSANGTFQATDTGFVDPLMYTFKLVNVGGGALVSFHTSLSGKQVSSFSVSQPVVDSGGGFASFQVTYTPQTQGTQTAVVHVATNDPIHPDYTFTVGAEFTPYVDLSIESGTVNFGKAHSIISGSLATYKFPIVVTNQGNIAVPVATPPMDLKVLLVNTSDFSMLPIESETTTALRLLKPGQSRTLTLSVPVPIGIPSGNYYVGAAVNLSGVLSETATSNNVFFGSQIVSVTQGEYAFSGTISGTTFPATIAANDPLNGSLAFGLLNTGNLTLPAGTKFTVQLIAISTQDASQTTIGPASTLTLGGLFSIHPKAIFLKGSLLASLPAGDYDLGVKLTPLIVLDGLGPVLLETTADHEMISLTVS